MLSVVKASIVGEDDGLPIHQPCVLTHLLCETLDMHGGERTVIEIAFEHHLRHLRRDRNRDRTWRRMSDQHSEARSNPLSINGVDPGTRLISATSNCAVRDRKSTRLNSSH